MVLATGFMHVACSVNGELQTCRCLSCLAVVWCGSNQTATHAIELMLDYITKMEVKSSADLA